MTGVECVGCSFCKGKGVDPFGLLSENSLCVVCGGRKKVWVASPSMVCAHCGGTGAIKRFTCTSCGGKGRMPAVESNSIPCPSCQGSGNDASVADMACLTCHGRGYISTDTPKRKRKKKLRDGLKLGHFAEHG